MLMYQSFEMQFIVLEYRRVIQVYVDGNERGD